MKNKNSPANFGAVVSVRGSVVDIRFDAHLPPIYSLLHAQDGEIAMLLRRPPGREAFPGDIFYFMWGLNQPAVFTGSRIFNP